MYEEYGQKLNVSDILSVIGSENQVKETNSLYVLLIESTCAGMDSSLMPNIKEFLSSFKDRNITGSTYFKCIVLFQLTPLSGS